VLPILLSSARTIDEITNSYVSNQYRTTVFRADEQVSITSPRLQIVRAE
jgi:hypothetical protein